MSRGPKAKSPARGLDHVVADVDRDLALEDVEALVLAVVDVQRRLGVRGSVTSMIVSCPLVSAAVALMTARASNHQRACVVSVSVSVMADHSARTRGCLSQIGGLRVLRPASYDGLDERSFDATGADRIADVAAAGPTS